MGYALLLFTSSGVFCSKIDLEIFLNINVKLEPSARLFLVNFSDENLIFTSNGP